MTNHSLNLTSEFTAYSPRADLIIGVLGMFLGVYTLFGELSEVTVKLLVSLSVFLLMSILMSILVL